MSVPARLADSGLPFELASFSALDRYFGRPTGRQIYVVTPSGLVELAKAFPDLGFTPVDRHDARLEADDRSVYIRCEVDENPGAPVAFPILDFYFNPVRESYRDPSGVYGLLREQQLPAPSPDATALGALVDAARLVSRYHYSLPPASGPGALPSIEVFPKLPNELERMLLTDVLTGMFPWKGLALLKREGFVKAYWPELDQMDGTGHSKEHHPEGNVWEHSLETFRYRKTTDLVLTLGLLLHDAGKPLAQPTKERRFDKHAEIGADLARRLLRRLGFDRLLVDNTVWLVQNHMYPSAIDSLPLYRTERLMSSPLFPVLLELYRCDLSSSYRGPDGYYRACRVFRRFIKHSENPFRHADGRKLVRLYVE